MLAVNTLVQTPWRALTITVPYGMYLAADKNTLEDPQRTDDANTENRGCERARTNQR
jgi:hypothetical protein